MYSTYCREKLIDRNVLRIIIRFHINVYLHQMSKVRWNCCFSDSFIVCNGIRQGQVGSPILFCVDIDGLCYCPKIQGFWVSLCHGKKCVGESQTMPVSA
jgi:hypothetical protein